MSGKDDTRAERLFAILGEIDPDMSAGDMNESKKIRPKTVWMAALGIAAVIALTVGIFNLRRRPGLEITPTAPTDDYAQIVTDILSTTKPNVSDTTVSETQKPDEDIMPELVPLNGDGIGGDEYAPFFYPLELKFSGIDKSLHNLRKDVDLEEWVDTLPLDNENGVRPDESVNVYSFIKAFGITREEAEKAFEPVLDSGDDQLITRQELDVFFSGDEEAIAQTLASEYTIVVGDRMYTPYWLYCHSIDDYIAAGITPEEIKKRESLYDELDYDSESGLAAGKAFLSKLKKYVPDIRFERLERQLAYGDISITVDGAEYDVFWLSSHTIQDFEEVGITTDDLKTVLEKMSPYGMTNQYEWIESCYKRMIDNMAGTGIPEDDMDDCIDDAVDEVIEEKPHISSFQGEQTQKRAFRINRI